MNRLIWTTFYAMEPDPRQAKTPDVSIIVVSYNTKEMTLECLRSIREQTTNRSFEVLFIDNDSSDGSFEAVREEFSEDARYRIEASTENLGFAGANNHLAREARGRYLLLLNPDTVVLDRAIDQLCDFADSRPENGIWGGRTVFSDRTLNSANCWGWYGIWPQICSAFGLTFTFPGSRLFNPRAYPTWDRSGVREVGIVTGCFFLITRELWERLGGFDPEFFMYGEEADLCQRARSLGARPIVSGLPTIIHHSGASEHCEAGKRIKLLDGEIRLLRRHTSKPTFQLHLALIRLGILNRAFCDLLRGRKRSTWTEVWEARTRWLRGSRAEA